MNPKYAPLFQGLTLNNGVTVKNRLAVAPLTHFGSNPDGTISDQEKTYLKNRAEGFGIFIAAATLVSPEGKTFYGQPDASSPDSLASLKETADIIKSQDALAILQIHHGGRDAIKDIVPDGKTYAPSDDAKSGAKAMSAEHVEKVIQAFADTTTLAIKAGFDGVEIHGANGFLLQQFYSGDTNRRNDKWGGSLEKRMAFPLAVTDACTAAREKAGKNDFIIGYRFSPEEPAEEGITMKETYALIDALAEKPLQYLHVSLWNFYNKVRRGDDTSKTRMELIHRRLAGRLPLIGVGNLLTADDLLKAFETGFAEFVACGKSAMLNPGVAKYIEEGRESDIVTVLDPAKPDHYGLPDRLWKMCLKGASWLPSLKN